MLTDIKIQAQQRDTLGRKASRKLARRGLVPGVLYGAARAPVNFQIDPRRLDGILHGAATSTTLFSFGVDGLEEGGVTIFKDVQHDPLTGKIIHADLYRISMDQQIRVKIPVHLVGTARGVKQQGGVLDFVCREIDVSCLPANIPERINVDVSEIDLGHALKLADVQLPTNVTIHTDLNTPIATVVAPAAEKAQATAEEEAVAAAPTEPEVIKKGKAEDEEGEKGEKKEAGAEQREKKEPGGEKKGKRESGGDKREK